MRILPFQTVYQTEMTLRQRLWQINWSLIFLITVIGGVGMYNSKASIDGAEGSTDFGFNIGAGFNIPLTGFGAYVEARYHHIPVDGGSFQMLPISVGIRF